MHQNVNVITSFLLMGGYGAFIWPAYLAMLTLFITSIIMPLRHIRRIKGKLRGKF